jgi:hypothetical protein
MSKMNRHGSPNQPGGSMKGGLWQKAVQKAMAAGIPTATNLILKRRP